jgi:uncharacterized protein (TIGR02996 family)
MWPDCASDPTGLALLHGARDNPDEEDRRLILADWLDDQGEDLVAHLMRLSIPIDTWLAFPAAIRERWRPWNGCWRGWPGIRPRSSMISDGDFPDSPWLCVVDLRFDNVPWYRQEVLARLRSRVCHVLVR